MRAILGKVLSLAVSVVVPLLGQGCTDGTTVLTGVSYAINRPSDNSVRYVTETSISGNYRYYWNTYITSWMYKNGSQLDSKPLTSSTSTGATVTHTYNRMLSVDGPATYSGTGYHQAYTPFCLYWQTITQQNGYTYGSPLTVARPTVAMDHPIWHLGGQGSFGTYQTSGVLTASASGATGVPSWTVVSGSQKLQLSCSNCTQTYANALQPSSGCSYDVVVKVSYGGFESVPFYVLIDRPYRLEYVNGNNDSSDSPSGNGYLSTVSYALKGMCGSFLTDMRGGEAFPSSGYGFQDQANNWPPGDPAYGLTNPSDVWTDSMSLTNCMWTLNQCYPDNANPQYPRLSNSIRRVPQEWWMGGKRTSKPS